MTEIVRQDTPTGFEIAIIGMSARFPGAANIETFWNNLKNGVESVAFSSDREVNGDPGFVKSKGGVLENKEFFDAFFFGYTPREAEIMSPQMRIFHECVWTALEEAGYNPGTYKGLIGLYAGASSNFRWEALTLLSGKKDDMGHFAASQLVDTSYLTTRISYKLNLKGPSVMVDTACSTSLTAVDMACRAILSGECDMALAGGVSLSSYPQQGYIYNQGMILSSDGHCRAFDAGASGTVGGEGAGIVVLKSLEDARADRDHIHAVIKGFAVNNDGEGRVGYSAPGVEGQAHVIRAALFMAEVEPESIGYIETHGTGTPLGDPIEIKALKLVFKTDKKGFCKIGSVKTNIGHLDRAAGIVGLIKTVLILKHKQIPPSLHFKTPNPDIDLENSPFRVNTGLTQWKNDKYPLRAGVSSFGIGGTNAHVILEEYSEGTGGLAPLPIETPSRQYQLILLSAKTETALNKMTKNLVEYFKKNLLNPGNHENPTNPGPTLADVAYTLQVGRKDFSHRKAALCSTREEALEILSPHNPKVHTHVVKQEDPGVIFMFPGQGSQYADMGRELYQKEPVFRKEMDLCFEILAGLPDDDIKEILYPLTRSNRSYTSYKSYKSHINRTEIAQPLLFVFETALAKLLMHWGISPGAMIGHSIGEYTAAHLSGVFSREDALKLVVLRGKLMQQMPTGSMLSAAISEEELLPLLKLKQDLSLAAVNSSRQCVVSGTHQATATFAKELTRQGYKTRTLHTSHAFHSKLMDPISEEFKEKVKEIKLNKPVIPYISNVTGHWLKTRQALDPGYWSTHLRHTVRFARGLTELLKEPGSIFVEVGPGKALTALLKQHTDKQPGHQAVHLVRHPKEEVQDTYFLLNQLGRLWVHGVNIDWAGFYSDEKRYRLSLPVYCFDAQRYRIEGDIFKMGIEKMSSASLPGKKPDMAEWFYVPSWERAALQHSSPIKTKTPGTWVVFMDECGLGLQLLKLLEQQQVNAITVKTGPGFDKTGENEYILDPAESNHYDLLFRDFPELNPDSEGITIAHLWGVTRGNNQGVELDTLDKTQDTGLFSLLHLTRAMGKSGFAHDVRIGVVTDNMQEVTGEELLCPQKATLVGAVKIIPLEYPNIRCSSIDVVLPAPGSLSGWEDRLAGQLLEELKWGFSQPVNVVAFRGTHRWQPNMKPHPLNRSEEPGETLRRFKAGGIYLVTGGLGGMGFTLAEFLATRLKARLILVGRFPFPPRQEWENWLDTRPENDNPGQKIRKINEWEKNGTQIMICTADVSHLEQMKEVVASAEKRFGRINGVIHTAGLADYEGVIQRRTREKTEKVMAPKVKGTLVLDTIFKNKQLDFLVLFSSIGNVLYNVKFGQVGYNAANEFLDSYAIYKTARDGIFTVAINWCDWLQVGMSVKAVKDRLSRRDADPGAAVDDLLYGAVTPAEGMEVFQRIMDSRWVRVAVSTQDLNLLLDQVNKKQEEKESLSTPLHPRPELSTAYEAPADETEKTLAAVWENFFGFKPVGINDDFFELGGDSLQVMTVSSHIQTALGIQIPLQVFFENPTIKKLGQYIGENIESEKTGYSSLEPVENKEFYPLAPAQKRIYILQQIQQDNISYNQPRTVTLEMEPDREKVEKIFGKLIARHESLRTSFQLIEEPVQIIRKPGEIDFKVEYYESGKGEDSDDEWVQGMVQDFVTPFDLANAPLFRACLIKVKENRTVLMVDLHHIISDGTSNGTFVKEFIQLYHGDHLPLLKLQYKDFSEWQNFQKDEGEMKKQEEFWTGQFAGDIPVLRLPSDYKRPEIQGFEGNSLEFAIQGETVEKLREYTGRADCTMFMVILALYNIFLAKLSGQEEIVTGTIVWGRRHPDLANIMGTFVNTLALRNYPKGNQSFISFLKEVKKIALQAFDNQDYQFEDLVDKLRLKRDTSRNPLFDVLFVHRSQHLRTPSSSNEALKPAESHQDRENHGYQYQDDQSKFDLVLASLDVGDRIDFAFGYSTKLFKKETIERFVKYFKEITAAVTGNENREILLKNIKISHELGEVKSGIYKTIESQLEF
ncbi:MAG: SDR family oxidoreductase [Candidatus Aminicenantes bacterium]|jgi:acyl transferase domain-containing protein/acyl carrier protein